MTNSLEKAFEELKKEEALRKKKKKPILAYPKEKRLAYYSGWHKDDTPVTEGNSYEKQKKLA